METAHHLKRIRYVKRNVYWFGVNSINQPSVANKARLFEDALREPIYLGRMNHFFSLRFIVLQMLLEKPATVRALLNIKGIGMETRGGSG